MPQKAFPNKNKKNPGQTKRTKSKLTPAMVERMWKPGQTGNPNGKGRGKTLFTRVKEMMAEPPKDLAPPQVDCRQDKVADAFVDQMEKGSYIHTKEFIDREEGKVPNRHADADGKPIKLWVGMPTDEDDPAAP